jgi:hypothetical protein
LQVVKKTKPNVAALREEYEAKKEVLADEWIPEELKKKSSSPGRKKQK